MKKIIRNLLLTLMLVVSAACVCFLGACGESSEDFVVTVLYPDGSPVNGPEDGTGGMTEDKVLIQICDASNEDTCYLPQELGADGKMTISASALAEELHNVSKYKVAVLGVPEGYTAEEVIYEVSSGTNAVTITLQAA